MTDLNNGSTPVAIVGMSLRLPEADNAEEFWKLLMAKKDAMNFPPQYRWQKEHLPANYSMQDYHDKVKGGFLKCRVDEFDGKFFGCSPAESMMMDPQQRLLLEATWEALEDAAIDASSVKNSNTGVFTGLWRFDYGELITEAYAGADDRENFRKYMGNALGTSASRIAHVFGLIGPNIATESGCSSSMVAIGQAVKALRAGETDLALAGGCNLILKPFKYEDFQGLLSPDGHCKVFDKAADGFSRAEGVGMFVLKRLKDALKDSNNILAIIRGYGAAQEGTSKSMGTPTVAVESKAMQLALKDAGLEPWEIDFVECHGTGTALGDPLEFNALTQVYKSSKRVDPLVIGSLKANIGHTEAMSGFVGIAKAILCFQKNKIPPHRELKKLNPRINLNQLPAVINLKYYSWNPKEDARRRYCGVSSFGITGTDVHIILEEPPQRIVEKVQNFEPMEKTQKMLTLSAKSLEALEQLISKYKCLLAVSPKLNLESLAYVSSTGRAHFNHRCTVLGCSVEEIRSKLDSNKIEKSFLATMEGGPKICFLFSGQGSQYSRMGKNLYECIPDFRKFFDNIEQILKEKYEISLKDVMWGDDSEKKLNEGIHSQLAIYCLEVALWQLWASWGIQPQAVIGHSFGEFAAATAAGSLTVQDALKLIVVGRSRFSEEVDKGSMLVVKASKTEALSLIHNIIPSEGNSNFWLDIAAVNTLEQTVISGPVDAIQSLESYCIQQSIKSTRLQAPIAFHSRALDKVIEKYGEVANEIEIPSSRHCGYFSPVFGRLLKDSESLDGTYWIRNTRESVNFMDASLDAIKAGFNDFLEIGAHPILSAFVAKNAQSINKGNSEVIDLSLIPSMRRSTVENEYKTLVQALSSLYLKGHWVNWEKVYSHQNISKNIFPLVPKYPFQRKRFWFDFSKTEAFHEVSTNFTKPQFPLLGSQIVLPTKNEIVFQNKLLQKNVKYLDDHVIGDFVLFPGAGFLEMCVSAGLFFSNNKNPCCVTVKNFTIFSPLLLNVSKFPETFVVTRNDQSEKNSVKHVTVYSKNLTNAQTCFFKHSSAEVCTRIINPAAISKPNFLNATYEEIDEKQMYQNLQQVGYNFGASFKSLSCIKKISFQNDNQSQTNFSAKVISPTDKEDIDLSISSYTLHPILIDAMIQLALISQIFQDLSSQNLTKLMLPVKIDLAAFFKPFTGATEFTIIYNCSTGEVSLFDEKSEHPVVCQISGISFVPTTMSALKATLAKTSQIQGKMIPLYEEIWIPAQTNDERISIELHNVISTANLRNPEKIFENMQCKPYSNTEKTRIIEDGKYLAKILFYHIFCKTEQLQKIKLSSQSFTARHILELLNASEENQRFISRILEMFVEDQLLLFDPISETYSLQNSHLNVYENDLKTENFNFDLESSSFYAHNFSSFVNDAKNDAALSCLYSNSEFSARNIYLKTSYCQKQLEMLRNFLKHLFLNLENKAGNKRQDGGIFKVLEVGAGTAAATQLVVSLLKKSNLKFAYDVTDISIGFSENLSSLFENSPSIRFRTFDLGQDPSSQGLIPFSYDMVIAFNVLHATPTILKSLENVRKLLKPGGIFCNLEIFAPLRYVDVIFGNVKGFWAFKDTELRTNHCFTDETKWKTCLNQTGFEYFISSKEPTTQVGMIVAQASNSVPILEHRENGKRWVLISQNFSKSLPKTNNLHTNELPLPIQVQNLLIGCNKTVITIETNSPNQFETEFEGALAQDPEGILYFIPNFRLPHVMEQISFFLPFLQHLCRHNFSKSPRILLISEGQVGYEMRCVVDPSPSVLLGAFRTFMTENLHLECSSVDLSPFEPTTHKALCIIRAAFGPHEPLQAYKAGHISLSRLRPLQNDNELFSPLTMPTGGKFQLTLPKSCSLADLKFSAVHLPISKLTENHVEVEIKAAGLNFRDIFAIKKPSELFKHVNTVGGDFAGVVVNVGRNVDKWKVGDCVLGKNLWKWSKQPNKVFDNVKTAKTMNSGPLASHTIMPQHALAALPPNMTFQDGATLATAFLTTYHCLVDVGKLCKDQIVLIHAGSGGVGLCAIQIAKAFGAKIICTAGSERKREYLRKFAGIEHVFNSRDLEFGSGILKVTHNKGVDLVLNSLTSPGFKETSLKVCKIGGKFIEISKLNVWTAAEVQKLRSDVFYSIEDLSQSDESRLSSLMATLNDWLNLKKVVSLPSTQFSACRIGNALHFLEKAKHIGKVVLRMPCTPMLSDRGSYLITGGLGGIGLQLCKWMCSNGAKHVILVSRNSPTLQAREEIQSLKLSGHNVVVRNLDISDFGAVEKLLFEISSNFPPLRGVMHAAGVLSDAMIPNQTLESFELVLRPKAWGAWNLHVLTEKQNLEHFVMFSSGTVTAGHYGQANHVAANLYLDALVHFRKSMGLIGQTINWGQWGEVGVAANLKMSVFDPISVESGLHVLKYLMDCHVTQAAPIQGDFVGWLLKYSWRKEISKYIPQNGNPAKSLKTETSKKETTSIIEISKQFHSEILEVMKISYCSIDSKVFFKNFSTSTITDAQKLQVFAIVQKFLKNVVTDILKLDEDIDSEENLQELGLDSLMFIDLRNKIQSLLGYEFTVNSAAIQNCNSISKLSQCVLEIIIAQ